MLRKFYYGLAFGGIRISKWFLKLLRANQNDEAGIPVVRNFCVVNGKRRKYEPILVFQKPKGHYEMFED